MARMAPSSMTHLEPRPATATDAAGIAECVRGAYSHYVERIGKPPGPMLDDYDQVVRDHHAYVIDDDGRIVAALVLMDKEDGILLDNVAVGRPVLGKALPAHADDARGQVGHRDEYEHRPSGPATEREKQ